MVFPQECRRLLDNMEKNVDFIRIILLGIRNEIIGTFFIFIILLVLFYLDR